MNNRIKKSLLVIILLVLVFGVTIKVDALCTSRKFSNLKMIAYKAEVSYELRFDNNHNYYYVLTVNNVDPNILVMFNGEIYETTTGTIEIPAIVTGGTTYDVKLYGGYETDCVEEYLYTKKISLPKYNRYSERDECIEYEEFYMCNKWYAGEIANDEVFEEELNKYKSSLVEKEPEEKEETKKNIIEKIIDFYTNNLIITLPITIAIGLFVIYRVIVILIRRKNRVKLDE